MQSTQLCTGKGEGSELLLFYEKLFNNQSLTSCRKWGLSLDPQTDEEKEEQKRGYDLNGFNQFRSDRIPLDRDIPDTRHPQ